MKYRKFLELVEKATGVRPTHALISQKLGGKPTAGALSNRYFNDGNLSLQELFVLKSHFPNVEIESENSLSNKVLDSLKNEIKNIEIFENQNNDEFVSNKGRFFKIPYWGGPSSELIKKYGVNDLNIDLEIIINDWHANPEHLVFIAMPGDDMYGGDYPIKNKDILVVDTSRNNIAESGVYFCTTNGHSRVYVRRIIEKMTDEINCVTTVDNPRYKSIIEKKWTNEAWLAADVQVIGRVIKNMSYTI